MNSKIIMRKNLPDAIGKLDELTKSIDKLSIEKGLSELIKLLASQINSCEYCIQLHTSGALKNGVDQDKIVNLKDWRFSSYYNLREKIAFEIAESITESSGNNLTKEICFKANEVFTQNEIAEIIMITSVINVWNRINITSKTYNNLI